MTGAPTRHQDMTSPMACEPYRVADMSWENKKAPLEQEHTTKHCRSQ